MTETDKIGISDRVEKQSQLEVVVIH